MPIVAAAAVGYCHVSVVSAEASSTQAANAAVMAANNYN